MGKHMAMGALNYHRWGIVDTPINHRGDVCGRHGRVVHARAIPQLCSDAFVLECSKGQGRIYSTFTEATNVVNAYQGELLGLMANHLILLSVNKLNSQLSGSMEIVSDCLGALKWVTFLPSHRIPSRCRHSDILKTILVHCCGLSFTTYYSHIKAHQDDNASFDKLSRKAQLNCICDHAAKQRLVTNGMEDIAQGGLFPLESVGV